MHSGVIRCDGVKDRKVPKFRVNSDHPSKETHVDRLACSGIRHSGETKCAKKKTLEVLKSRVNLDCPSKETCVGRLTCLGI
jgi:hypothetical protein